MSTKKQFSRLYKLYTVYEEIPEDSLDETDVESYIHHNILDISKSHHRIGRFSKGSNNKSFGFKVFHFCDSKLQQRFNLKEEVSISKKKIESLLDSLGDSFETCDQANNVSQIPLPKPKLEIGFTKAKDELFSHCYEDIVEQLNRQSRISFPIEKNKTCNFSIKNFEQYGDQFILTEVVNLSYCEIISTRIDFLLLTNVTFLRAITMCSALIPDCGYDKSTSFLIGDVYCPNTKCVGKLCLHKKTFQSLGRSHYQCLQCVSVCQVRKIPFEDQTNSFFLSFGPGVYIFEDSPKSIQDVI